MSGRKRSMMALLLTLSVGAPVWAQASRPGTRAEAQRDGQAGIDACKRGDYSTALAKLERAYSLVKAPSLAFWSARALRGQGKLVQAAERYSEAMQLDATSGDAEIQKLAQRQAAQEYAALVPIIPGIKIEIQGLAPEAVEVEVDGVIVPSVALASRLPVDPGDHLVLARGRGKVVEQRLRLDTGETKTVLLELASEERGQQRAVQNHVAVASPARAGGAPTPIHRATDHTPGAPQRTAGWVSVGVGGAGLVLWGVTGVAGLVQARDLDHKCPNRTCPPGEDGALAGYRALRTLSTAGFAAGLAGLGVGATLLLTAPRERIERPPTSRIAPFLGTTEVGLRGEF